MSTSKKILTNTAIQVLGKIGMAAASIVTVRLITEYLGTTGYGDYSQVYELLALFGIFSDFGLFTIAVREMAKDESKIPYVLGNIFTVRLIASVFAMLLAIVSIFIIPKYDGTLVPIGVSIASIGVFLTIMNGTISSVLQVHLKMQQATLALIVGKIVSLSYTVWVIFKFTEDIERGFIHLMWAGVFGSLVMAFITWMYTRRLTNIKPRFDIEFWNNVVVKSLPYGIALVLNMIYFRINSVFLYYIKGASETGLFALPIKIIEILTVVSIYFMNSVLPSLTKLMKKRDIKEYREKANKMIQYCFDFLTYLGLPMVVGAVTLAYPIIYLISTPEFLSRISEGFYGSDIALQILIFALFFSYLNTLLGFLLVSLNKQNQMLFVSVIGVIVSVSFNLLLIPKYGFRGASFTSVISELFILVSLYALTRKFFDYKISFKNSSKALFCSLVMGVFIILTRPITYELIGAKSVILLIPLAGIIYTACMFLTRALSRKMIQDIF